MLLHPKLRFIRRKHEEGRHYFIANQSMEAVDGWVPLGTKADSVVLLDPMTGESGALPVRQTAKGYPEVFLKVLPGHSVMLRTYTDKVIEGPAWEWRHPDASTQEIAGPWKVEFLEGGPVLPKAFTQSPLSSWTEEADPECQRFAGTARYRTTFDAPEGNGPWYLDLGAVKHSANVRLNGEELGTVFMHPYRILVDTLKATGNVLEVEATNLSMNRLRDLDRRGVEWRKFHDINFVSIKYEPFDASAWPVQESGLLGPVTLRNAESVTP